MLPLLPLCAVVILLTAAFMWLARTGHSQTAEKHAPAIDTAAKNVDKLRGFHSLAKDALEAAHQKDHAGGAADAIKTYRIGGQIIDEGLRLDVPSVGLGPNFSNTARWRADLTSWKLQAAHRLAQLEAGCAPPAPAASIPSSTQAEGWAALRKARPAPTHPAQQQPQPQQPPATRPQSAHRPAPHAGTAASPAAAAAAPGTRGRRAEAEEAQLREAVLGEVLQRGSSVRWPDVAGLDSAKQALQEMVILPALRADLFRGLRAPARGLLLYGPPGNGKTLLAKALAAEAKATFFNISASSLTSKWHGEGEKLVRTLFAVATEMQPSIVFIDEIDSILSERSSGEHEASRRLKTEFLLQFDGVASDQSNSQVVVVGATNRPWELDEAMRRRLQKRIYIPLPDTDGRRALLLRLLDGQPSCLSASDIERIVRSTAGYSGSDLSALCREAAMQPIRELGSAVAHMPADRIRAVAVDDFSAALEAIKPSVGKQQMEAYTLWTKEFGST